MWKSVVFASTDIDVLILICNSFLLLKIGFTRKSTVQVFIRIWIICWTYVQLLLNTYWDSTNQHILTTSAVRFATAIADPPATSGNFDNEWQIVL